MISPRRPIDSADVAHHYEELDRIYRAVWGEDLRHGVWHGPADRAGIAEATTRLLEIATAPLALARGHRLVDVGCGYGTGARWIAERYHTEVTGLTLSARQVEVAHRPRHPSGGSVTIRREDWLTTSLPDNGFDAAVAIESLAHMTDKALFFAQLARTLRPGGRAAIACWLAADDPSPLEGALLRAICADGRLAGIGTLAEYEALAVAAGLQATNSRLLTQEVARTWVEVTRNLARLAWSDPGAIPSLAWQAIRTPGRLWTVPRLLLANRTGALAYGILWLAKPTA